jgi:nucleoside-diphosphate-sugar epimerase
MLVHKFNKAVPPARVVVLGAKGFVADALIASLCREGIPCRPVGSAEVDLIDCTAVERLRRILAPHDTLVMTSAITPEHGRDSATFLRNVKMADHVCTALCGIEYAHVIYISSDSVYRPQCEMVTERCCCEPSDMYSLSHLVRERMLAEVCRVAARPLAILRPGAIYGAADTHNSYGPNRFVRSALHEGRITLFGDGEELRDHIFIADVVRIIHLCLLHRSAGVLNAVTGKSLSFAAVAQEVIDAVGGGITVEKQPRRVTITHREFDAAAIQAAFPEFQFTQFAAGIRQAITECRGVRERTEKQKTTTL